MITDHLAKLTRKATWRRVPEPRGRLRFLGRPSSGSVRVRVFFHSSCLRRGGTHRPISAHGGASSSGLDPAGASGSALHFARWGAQLARVRAPRPVAPWASARKWWRMRWRTAWPSVCGASRSGSRYPSRIAGARLTWHVCADLTAGREASMVGAAKRWVRSHAVREGPCGRSHNTPDGGGGGE